MNSEPRCADQPNLSTNFGPRRADVLGLLQLLLSASASLELYRSDPVCTQILSDCIADFGQRHGLSKAEFASGIMWSEQSVPALVRLLVYAHAEAADTLNDARCAEHLEKCVAHLMQTYRLSPEHLYDPKLLNS